jgi:hypothetical protein
MSSKRAKNLICRKRERERLEGGDRKNERKNERADNNNPGQTAGLPT